MDSVWRVILIFMAFGGFLLAFYIRHKKQSHEKMVCPLNSDCDSVIYSKYSKFFGIPVEILGLSYYAVIVVSYTFFLAFPHLAPPLAVFTVLALTIAAFLFSLYLTFIQIVAIKQWCTWCLISAGICAVIFAIALLVSEFGFIPLLDRYRELILIGHFLGVALGLGGATIVDILFFKFLKDFRISEQEAGVIHTLSQIIWFSLVILVLTGIGLYIPEAEELNQSAKFLVKMIVVAVIIINGTFLNLLVAPKLVRISFGEKHDHQSGELHHERKIAFALGAVSLVSWYSAFILGIARNIPIEFWQLLFAYLAILIAAIIVSQIAERVLINRAN